MRQRIFITELAAIAAGAIMLGLGSESRAENVRITVSGTVATADPGMGYTVGQPVSFFWEINDFAPATPSGHAAAGSSYYWEDERQADPQLFAAVGGTGITGTYKRPPAAAPLDSILAKSSGELRVWMETDGFSAVNNHGIALAANPNLLIDVLGFGPLFPSAVGFSGFTITGTLPDPATFFADYAGSYGVQSFLNFFLDARNPADLVRLRASFTPTSMTIAPVPEPSSIWLLAAGGLGGAAWVAARRRTR